MSFAVVQSGGHQYTVREGSLISHSTLEVEVGDVIDLKSIGGWNDSSNINEKCVVKAEVLKHGRSPKVIIFKKLRRHNYRRFNTHRQGFTLLRVKTIEFKS